MAKDVEFKDLGIEKLKRELAQLGKEQITIGHQGASGKARHPGSNKATVGEVASWLEFGTRSMAARPFARTTLGQAKATLDKAVRKGLSDLIDGRDTVTAVQDSVAKVALGELRATIDRSREWAAPLAQSTIDRKGHDQPLVDTGTLRKKASWAVRGSRSGGGILRQGGEK